MTTLQSIQELHNQVFNQSLKQIDDSEAVNMMNKIKQSKSFEEKYQLLMELFLGYDNITSLNNELREFTNILSLMKKINRPNSVKDKELETLFEQALLD